MKQQTTSIQKKLMQIILLTCGIVLLLVCSAFYTYEYYTFRQSLKKQMQTLGEIIALNSTAAVAFKSPEDATEILEALKSEANVEAACIYDERGQLFARYPAGVADSVFPRRPGAAGYAFKRRYLEGFEPIVQEQQFLGTLYLKSDYEALYDRLLLYAGITILFVLASFILAYFLSMRLQRTISRPILELVQASRIISDERDYSVRAVISSNDELGTLTDAFNHMLGQIELQNRQIVSFNQALEEKIRLRTRELEFANEELGVVNEKLIRSNRDLEQFAYIASHDLQEPLRKIQTFSGLAEKSLPQNGTIATYLTKIRASAERMTALIHAVLDYSRIIKTNDGFQPVDLNMIVTNIRDDFELMITEKKATIVTNDLPVIAGIPLQLAQLFYNLVSNSLKFSDKPPLIKITGDVLEGATLAPALEADKDERYARIVFEDNGIGFDQEYAERIFSLFQRLHNKQDYPGTGIGLALCKKIVENHQGLIEVQSTPGGGTIFTLYLPVSREGEGVVVPPVNAPE